MSVDLTPFETLHHPTREQVTSAIKSFVQNTTRTELEKQLPSLAPGEPAHGIELVNNDQVLVILNRWRKGAECAPHDHGGMDGVVYNFGTFSNQQYFLVRPKEVGGDPKLIRGKRTNFEAGETLDIYSAQGERKNVLPVPIHSMRFEGNGVSNSDGLSLNIHFNEGQNRIIRPWVSFEPNSCKQCVGTCPLAGTVATMPTAQIKTDYGLTF